MSVTTLSLSSAVLGHHIDNRRLTEEAGGDGCREYGCVQCGHPLVYPKKSDPYRLTEGFRKKVRYLCWVFGHRVSQVTARDGYVEHACHCGHSFLKPESRVATIRHPMIGVLVGHYVKYVTCRGGYDEFVCVNCGHPFCLGEGRMTPADVLEL